MYARKANRMHKTFMVAFVITLVNARQMLQEIEWSTLFFFIGLFIL